MKVGLQLWGFLHDNRLGMMEAMEQLRGMGFDRVEPCVSFETVPGLENVVWTADWFIANIGEIRKLGLEIVSCHIFADDIAAEAEKIAQLSLKTGVKMFVVPCPQERTEEGLAQAAVNYTKAADMLAGVGAELMMHNMGGEIAAHVGGRTAFEYMLDQCGGKVGAQVDVGWIYAGGEDPEAFLWRNKEYVKSVHFKDFVRESEGMTEAIPGTGDVDTTACFQFARASGCTQVIDMDTCADGWEKGLPEALKTLRFLADKRPNTDSFLNVLDTQTGEVRNLARYDKIIEAPNWLKGENSMLFNADGRIFKYNVETGEETMLDCGECVNCNNDHVVSPDETQLAVSHMTFDEGFTSRVYVVPMSGGEARLVTPETPSFLHGWSPDGGEFAYCAFRMRDGQRAVDVYTIPAEGGAETRLTNEGFNDGPEYSPDGKYIWYNSTRSGLMQIWRMKRDGSEQTQMTFNERNNWFAHVSPDGEKIAYISYGRDDLCPDEHLPNMQVELWMMNADGSDQRKIASIFGGQGSVNVNSWAADSRHLAFVSYELKHK